MSSELFELHLNLEIQSNNPIIQWSSNIQMVEQDKQSSSDWLIVRKTSNQIYFNISGMVLFLLKEHPVENYFTFVTLAPL